jgi:DNA-binding transcriptional MerR regulator
LAHAHRIHEFAQLADVTVRTLHHYDRLGLLKPQRTQAGYRLYTLNDLERLEQIVALKFLGLPLKRIKTLLDRGSLELPNALRMQRAALQEKRRLLDQAISAIEQAEKAIRRDRPVNAQVFGSLIAAFKKQDSPEFMKKYFSEEAWTKWSRRQKHLSPQARQQASQAWVDLFREVEMVLADKPSSPRAQALAVRWLALVDVSTAGDEGVKDGFTTAWTGRENWPARNRQRIKDFNLEKIASFIGKAIALRKA